MQNPYENKYNQNTYYWGLKPSLICYEVLKFMPPIKSLKLLDIGCGEGRNAVFFARNGYNVTAFDLSRTGIEKTKRLAEQAGVAITTIQADINQFRLTEEYDILFSTGVLHYIPQNLRQDIFRNYKEFTSPKGIHVFSVFVNKPFIPKAPDAEPKSQPWLSGELFTYYHNWEIKYCTEEVFDCMSSNIPHKHACNRVIAQKISPTESSC